MRTVLVILLVTGIVHSAIVDSSKSPPQSKKGDWDDEDSMTLIPTTTTRPISVDVTTTNDPTSSEDQITEEQQRPRFISLIPAGTHSASTHSKSDQENQDQFKYRVYSNTVPTTTVSPDSEQDDSASSGSSTTQSSSSSDEEESSQDSTADDQVTTERSRIKHIQLGKIPLTYEIIPLLPPREEKQQLLGREDTKPISFFPPEETMMEKAKMLRKEQQQQQQQQTEPTQEEIETTEIITGKPVPDLQELPPVPLTYMIPPKQDENQESYWNKYQLPSTTYNLRNLESPQTTVNPLLETLNDFLKKAKRHYLEMETTTSNDKESTTSSNTTPEVDASTEKVEQTTTTERLDDNSTEDEEKADNQDNVSTTDPFTPLSDNPEDSNGDLNPSSPATVPEEPTEGFFATRGPTTLYPRPGSPEIQDYSTESSPLVLPYPPSSSPLPPIPNSISISPPSMDQYFSDYNNLAPAQQRPLNQYYFPNSNQGTILQRRLMASLLDALGSSTPVTSTSTTTLPPPPARPLYISPDSYWPNKYYNGNGAGSFGGSRGGSNGYYRNSNSNNMYTPNYNNNNNYNTNYNYNPFMSSQPTGGFNNNNNDYAYYLRPQRRSPAYPTYPTTSTAIPIDALNSILSSSEEPSPPSYAAAFGNAGDRLNDFSSYGIPYYSRSSGGDNYYSTRQSPSPYVLNYRPNIPYRLYPVTSSDLVNQLMYAPLYPYEQYRRFPVQSGYF